MPDKSNESITPISASGNPARFRKLENIDAPKSSENNLAVNNEEFRPTSSKTCRFNAPLKKVIKRAPAAPMPAASVAENNPI